MPNLPQDFWADIWKADTGMLKIHRTLNGSYYVENRIIICGFLHYILPFNYEQTSPLDVPFGRLNCGTHKCVPYVQKDGNVNSCRLFS